MSEDDMGEDDDVEYGCAEGGGDADWYDSMETCESQCSETCFSGSSMDEEEGHEQVLTNMSESDADNITSWNAIVLPSLQQAVCGTDPWGGELCATIGSTGEITQLSYSNSDEYGAWSETATRIGVPYNSNSLNVTLDYSGTSASIPLVSLPFMTWGSYMFSGDMGGNDTRGIDALVPE
jgi:hypothetical protein